MSAEASATAPKCGLSLPVMPLTLVVDDQTTTWSAVDQPLVQQVARYRAIISPNQERAGQVDEAECQDQWLPRVAGIVRGFREQPYSNAASGTRVSGW